LAEKSVQVEAFFVRLTNRLCPQQWSPHHNEIKVIRSTMIKHGKDDVLQVVMRWRLTFRKIDQKSHLKTSVTRFLKARNFAIANARPI